MSCWICGNKADSREHKIKKSDLISLYGKGPYKEPLLLMKGKKAIKIQGPDQIHLKYKKTICSACNNVLTQPFDRAYELFVRYVLENEKLLYYKRFFDFESVYGIECDEAQRNLFKYLVKSLGCRIVEAGYDVPKDLSILLYQNDFLTSLYINFAINEDKALFIKGDHRFTGLGNLLTTENNLRNKNEHKYQWNSYISFVTISFWYAWYPDGNYGCPWTANSKFIYFGCYRPLTEKMRNELLEKSKTSSSGCITS